MSEWQPIETCPEHLIVLLFGITDCDDEGRATNWRIGTGALSPPVYPRPNETKWTWGGRQVMVWEPHPSHWQPVPEPPPIKMAPKPSGNPGELT